jgi:hypothetical protein
LPPRHLWKGQGKLVLIRKDIIDESGLNMDQRPPQTQPIKDLNLSICADTINSGRPAHPLLIPPMLPKFNAGSPPSLLLPNKITFPLSPDHHLITLIQYNVKRALLTNMTILGTLHFVHGEKQAALSLPPLPIPLPVSIPPSFEPTELQRLHSHDPLISSVPSPSMRDNLILHAERYDMNALASDIYGGLFDGFSNADNRGVMVWGEPWRSDSWEISEGFASRWGFLINGCTDLIESTNRWRSKRGEERLVIEW